MTRSNTRLGADAALTGYDAELRRLDAVFRPAWGIAADDRVLDIGCGTGQTTRAAARAAHRGRALGVDVSPAAVERARVLAVSEGLGNVAFACADAQRHPFPEAGFDLAISRFGTMFFDDAVTAFTNVARALRPAGRLVMMVWQARDLNEWDVALRRAVGGEGRAVDPAGSDAFSLADPALTAQILDAAGFTDVDRTDVAEPVWYGADAERAEAWVRGFTCTRELIGRLDPERSARSLARLRETLAAHLRDDGVWFGSRAWIVTARRR